MASRPFSYTYTIIHWTRCLRRRPSFCERAEQPQTACCSMIVGFVVHTLLWNQQPTTVRSEWSSSSATPPPQASSVRTPLSTNFPQTEWNDEDVLVWSRHTIEDWFCAPIMYKHVIKNSKQKSYCDGYYNLYDKRIKISLHTWQIQKVCTENFWKAGQPFDNSA